MRAKTEMLNTEPACQCLFWEWSLDKGGDALRAHVFLLRMWPQEGSSGSSGNVELQCWPCIFFAVICKAPSQYLKFITVEYQLNIVLLFQIEQLQLTFCQTFIMCQALD